MIVLFGAGGERDQFKRPKMARAAAAAETDWVQIVALYDQLMQLTPSPIVGLNRAIAVAESGDLDGSLEAVERLDLDDYHLYHATRGNLLERLGRHSEAAEAYRKARSLTVNDAEIRHLERLERSARLG